MNSIIQAQVNEYVYSKMIQSMIFRKKIEDLLEHERWQGDITSVEFLKALKNIIVANEHQEIIEPMIKNNLYRIIDHLRFNKLYQSASEKQENYETYNFLISLLNNSKDTNKYKFYAREICKRYNHIGFSGMVISLVYTPFVIEKDKQYLFDSISNDFGVIANQSDLVDDYHFRQEVMPEYTNNHYYIDSINAILYEEPYLLSDFTFLDRTSDVLEKNREDEKKYDKYLIKRNNQTLKRINSYM
ncbi:MAG: hypothetical protein ACM3O4_05135 [Ignavibacteriales bacterium]